MPIQKIIQVTMATATSESMPPSISCAWNVIAYGPQVSRAPDAERDRHGDADADPELAEQVATAELAQVRDEDADDESCFEAFAEADQVVGEHARLPGSDRVD